MKSEIIGKKKIITIDYVNILMEYLANQGISADDALENTGLTELAIVNW